MVTVHDAYSVSELREHYMSRRVFRRASLLDPALLLVMLCANGLALLMSLEPYSLLALLLSALLVVRYFRKRALALRHWLAVNPRKVTWTFRPDGLVAQYDDGAQTVAPWSHVPSVTSDERYLRLNLRSGSQTILHRSLFSESDLANIVAWHAASMRTAQVA